jgi:tRNA pseudouridine38-40 synthase
MEYIVGTHDFKSFSKNKITKNTVRTIESFKLDVDGTLLTFKIVGTGFMYNMVRIIVALMLKVGEGKFEPAYIQKVLDGKDRALAPYVAPANGLYLYKVNYDRDYDI